MNNQTWSHDLIPEVEGILEQHYYQRDNGAYQHKSSTAAVADKCYQSGYRSRKCRDPGCNNGEHSITGRCSRCNGTGREQAKVPVVHFAMKACPKCKGTAVEMPKRDELLSRLEHLDGDYRVMRIDPKKWPCLACEGNGYVENYGVHPKPAQIFGSPVDSSVGLEDENLRLTECLSTLQQMDPDAEIHLLMLYGAGRAMETTPIGQQFGREVVLWQFTPYGAELLELGRRGNPALKTEQALLNISSQACDDTISALVSNAHVYAQALRFRALHKLFVADSKTGGHIKQQAVDRKSK